MATAAASKRCRANRPRCASCRPGCIPCAALALRRALLAQPVDCLAGFQSVLAHMSQAGKGVSQQPLGSVASCPTAIVFVSNPSPSQLRSTFCVVWFAVAVATCSCGFVRGRRGGSGTVNAIRSSFAEWMRQLLRRIVR